VQQGIRRFTELSIKNGAGQTLITQITALTTVNLIITAFSIFTVVVLPIGIS
jgi:hypothetical protein